MSFIYPTPVVMDLPLCWFLCWQMTTHLIIDHLAARKCLMLSNKIQSPLVCYTVQTKKVPYQFNITWAKMIFPGSFITLLTISYGPYISMVWYFIHHCRCNLSQYIWSIQSASFDQFLHVLWPSKSINPLK